MERILKKYKCPECNNVNPIMELMNTVTCQNCKSAVVDLVEDGFVIINSDTWEVIKISEEEEKFDYCEECNDPLLDEDDIYEGMCNHCGDGN